MNKVLALSGMTSGSEECSRSAVMQTLRLRSTYARSAQREEITENQ